MELPRIKLTSSQKKEVVAYKEGYNKGLKYGYKKGLEFTIKRIDKLIREGKYEK